MLNAQRKILEDSARDVDSTLVTYAGRPLSLSVTDGKLIAATSGSKFYGLSRGNKNSYVDITNGEFGAFGSNKMSVVKSGIIEIGPEDLSIYTGGTVFQIFDSTKTYYVNDKLYVSADNLITNDTGEANGYENYVGRVIVPPSSTYLNMVIDLKSID